MPTLPEYLTMPSSPGADPGATVVGEHYRITVLTPALLRIEWSPSGRFEDRASQLALNRRFEVPEFSVSRTRHGVQVITSALQVNYDEREFSPAGLVVKGKHGYHAEWRYGAVLANPFMALAGLRDNLGGTIRTLDAVDGPAPLEPGLMSWRGITALDDSHTLLLTEQGWLEPRQEGAQDWYVFGHGHDYQAALRDFYALSGPQPMLPRFALGNWWSRYHAYSDTEYRRLMERFADNDMPFSVAVVDMDWHLTDIDPKYGHGWTGYTWNRELFPDPEGFLAWLHERGMQVALNVHPGDGVRAHEQSYPEMARAMGIDPATELPVNFDISDPRFLTSYLELVHHPHEDAGVDFWWLDWQQGQFSGVTGLDPLWMLNHFHYLDSGRAGRRRLTFSRYAGPGSHRYPVGFSGDVVISWESLAFQPYFTATASNIGYGWWSHDIGGHCFGVKDDELATRWVQFGVFSPIMRLHSGNEEFNGKEPWRYNAIAEQIQGEFLRLRHRMLPYLYTMNERAAHHGVPLLRPMYHSHPEEPDAYRVDNQYWFGSQLIAAPITTPVVRGADLAQVGVWLPEGTWVDIFTGVVYSGGRRLTMHRDLASIPVLARGGAIVPLTGEGQFGVQNPTGLQIRVYGGASGSFELYEDDDAAEPRSARTRIDLDWDASVLTIHPAAGDLTVLPASRQVQVMLCGVRPSGVPGHDSSYDPLTGTLTLDLGSLPTGRGCRLEFDPPLELHDNQVSGRLHALLDRAEVPFADKLAIWDLVQSEQVMARLSARLGELDADPVLLAAARELVDARV